MKISAKTISQIYYQILRIRKIELEISKEYTEWKMRCPVHLSIGQEAAAVGVCSNLNKDDQIFSTHRCHAHYLAKGGDLKKMIFQDLIENFNKKTSLLKMIQEIELIVE